MPRDRGMSILAKTKICQKITRFCDTVFPLLKAALLKMLPSNKRRIWEGKSENIRRPLSTLHP